MKSINIFLVVQGIFFVAVFQAIISGIGYYVTLGVAGIGLSYSFMWLFVNARKGATIMLLEHQLRHLEEEIFSNRLEKVKKSRDKTKESQEEFNNSVKKILPMYFWAARAIFLRRRGIRRVIKENEFEKDIREHHFNEFPEKIIGFAGRSSMKIISYGLPTPFLFAWSLAIGIMIGYIIINSGS